MDLELVLTWAQLKVNGYRWNRELERKGRHSLALSIAHSCVYPYGTRSLYLEGRHSWLFTHAHAYLWAYVQTPTCTAVQTQSYAHVCVRLGPRVIVRGLWWECGVVGEMDSFLKRVPPQPLHGGHGVGQA